MCRASILSVKTRNKILKTVQYEENVTILGNTNQLAISIITYMQYFTFGNNEVPAIPILLNMKSKKINTLYVFLSNLSFSEIRL